jgi:hypothetical protein
MSSLQVPWSGLCVVNLSIRLFTSCTDTHHSQLKRNKIFSKQLKSKVTRLVYLVIGTGALTGIFTTFSQSIVTSEGDNQL